MREHLATIAAFLATGAVIQTRLRERSTGEVHDILPRDLPGISGLSLRPEALVAALEHLEQRGVVRRFSEAVHAHDGSEYRVSWRLAGGE